MLNTIGGGKDGWAKQPGTQRSPGQKEVSYDVTLALGFVISKIISYQGVKNSENKHDKGRCNKLAGSVAAGNASHRGMC